MTKVSQFLVGTIVKLKSGGPEMTVQKVIANLNDQFTGSYKCQWFAGKKLEDGVFPEESLELMKTDSKGA